jgi:Zn-dependent protease
MDNLTLIQKITIWALPLLFAITAHEVAHGFVASLFGDKTAKLAGRLTLNPIKHIDPMGTIFIPLLMLLFSPFIFGWAKPVPIDARNMRNPRFNMVIVSLAGPISNLLMAIFWAGIMRLGYMSNEWFGIPLVYMGDAGVWINLVLAVLNCIPIPPLDGGRALMNALPGRMGYYLFLLEPYGFFILLLLLFTGLLNFIIYYPVFYLREWILILFGLS